MENQHYEMLDPLILLGWISDVMDKNLAELLSEAGVQGHVASHGAILNSLFIKGEAMSMSEIAAKIRKTKATTTILIDKLVKQGLVKTERDHNDQRVVLVSLTKKGDKERSVHEGIISKARATFFGDMSMEDQKKLFELLMKIAHNLKIME